MKTTYNLLCCSLEHCRPEKQNNDR